MLTVSERAAVISTVLNISFTLLKLLAGLLSGSLGLIAETVHSAMDSFSSIIAFSGLHFGKRPPDVTHPYGHGKIETFSGALITLVLIISGVTIAWEATQRILKGSYVQFTVFGFIVVLVSIFFNEALARYEFKIGQQTASISLIADSYHARSDVLSSISVLIGLVGVKFGFLIIDSIAALAVTILIIRTGVRIGHEAIDVLLDISPRPEVIKDIETTCLSVPGVKSCHAIRARKAGGRILVDLHIKVDPGLTVKESHKLATKAETRIKDKIAGIESVLTHVEPLENKNKGV
ncbi:MAG: cation diffusion facilitator family transporter [Euryarchaeota archaeon]|nr:cation diffusion facilitator family transporter [Euryarchaeota archaeon]